MLNEQTKLTKGEVICPNPNCGHRCFPVRKAKGSKAAAIILLLLMFPIGLIYVLLNSGYVYSCPYCRNELRPSR